MTVNAPVLGVIGGSGLYGLEGLEQLEEVSVETPFGAPSDALLRGRLGEREIWFLPRHGRGHRLSPSDVPFRANVFAMRQVGVTHLLSVSAVGSMREDIEPGHLVVVDQFFDRTKRSATSFFGTGLVAHVVFADPVCEAFRQQLLAACRAETPGGTHDGGTYICMEGPAFSTRAESRIYRSWGVDVIGMTNLPEAKLAREAELCFATLALATDYDCWHEEEDDVSVEAVIQTLRRNTERAKAVIARLAGALRPERSCGCPSALAHAIMTSPAQIDPAQRERLDLLVGRYL